MSFPVPLEDLARPQRPEPDAVAEREPWVRRGLAVLPVLALAVASLWWPDHGDQTLFRLSAVQLNNGWVYYRDIWDIKQPGVYWFYQLGEVLIPGGVGARVLEALLAVVAAVLVTRITASWDLRRSVRLAAPTVVLGPYLVWSFNAGVGQIEGLMNVLILAVVAAVWPTEGKVRPGWSWFVAGLAIGAVVLLKTLYGPIPFIVLAAAIWPSARINRRASVLGSALALLGIVLPVIGALIYFADHGILDLALRTTFEMPAEVAKSPVTHNPGNRGFLAQSIKNMFAVVGPLAVVGLLTARRTGRLLLSVALTAVAATAFALTIPQLWTPYRWLMLAAPVGLLAVDGLEFVLARLAARQRASAGWGRGVVFGLRAAAAVAVVGLTLPMLNQPINLVRHAGDVPWGLDQMSRIGRSPDGPWLTESTSVVADQVTPGEQIYVFGDPGLMALLHATQGAEITGWSMEMMPQSVWDELARELSRSRPALIFFDTRDWDAYRATEGEKVFALLDEQYRKAAVSPGGTWYRAKDPGQPLPEPGGTQLYSNPNLP